MLRWLVPVGVTVALAVALFAFPDEVGAVDEDGEALEHVGCGGVIDSGFGPDVFRNDLGNSDAGTRPATEPFDPQLPTLRLYTEEAPGSGLPWAWFALAAAVGGIGVAGVAFAVRPLVARR